MIKTIQYGSKLVGSSPETVTLATTVDKNYSVITFIGVNSISGSNDASQNAARVVLDTGSTVKVYINNPSSSVTVYFRVVEYFPFTMRQPVQHVSDTTSFTSTTNAEVFYGGFESSVTGGTTQDSLGAITKASASTVTTAGGVNSATHYSYCVADWK